MKSKLFLSILILVSSNVLSQSFCEEIKSVVTDSTSQYFYPLLLEKVKNNPEKIDEADCYYLYYGQVFQSNFRPLGSIGYQERMDLEIAMRNESYNKVIRLGKILLERNPVDLTSLLYTAMCIDKKKKYIDNEYIAQRYSNLLSAIFFTGDGKTKETAIKIVCMEDDYVLKGVLGLLGGKEQLMFDNNKSYSVWVKNDKKIYFEDVYCKKQYE